jgi:hypothetical protein
MEDPSFGKSPLKAWLYLNRGKERVCPDFREQIPKRPGKRKV